MAGGDLGRIATGYAADLIAVAVAGDPTTDVASLRRPLVVIKEGRWIIDRR